MDKPLKQYQVETGGVVSRRMTLVNSATIFKYNPHLMEPDDVLRTCVGRDKLRDELIEWLRSQRGATKPEHFMLYGPRGMGKTTMLLVLRYNIERNVGLSSSFLVVQFPEEERRVTNMTTFVMRTFELLVGQAPELREDFENAREKVQKHPECALDLLIEAGERLGDRQVLFLIDNFDDLVLGATSKKAQLSGTKKYPPVEEFRRFLSCGRFLVAATSLVNPAKFKKFPRKVLSHFQEPRALEPVPDAMMLLKRRAENDRREGFLERLPQMAGRIKGLERLADMNPRLLVFLYDCLGDGPLLTLVEIVNKLMDDLTPMYQDVIDKLLNRGQAAILEVLVENGGVAKASELAAMTYQNKQTVRTLLGDLCNMGLIKRASDKSAEGEGEQQYSEVHFRVNPPLFQIWYEMRHFERESSLYLVKFFSHLSEREELLREYEEMLGAGRMENSAEVSRLVEDVLDVLDPVWDELRREFIDGSIADGGGFPDALRKLDDALEQPDGALRMVGLLMLRAEVKIRLGERIGAKEDIDKAEEAVIEAHVAETSVKFHASKSNLLAQMAKYQEAAKEAQQAVDASEALTGASAVEIQAAALVALAGARNSLDEYQAAITAGKRAGDLLDETGNPRLRNRVAYMIGVTYSNLADYDSAKQWLEDALRLARETGNPQIESFALGKLGVAYRSLGDSKRAIEYYEEALSISREIGDRREEGSLLGSLGNAYSSLGDSKRAMEYHEQALAISREIGDRGGEGIHLGNLGSAYLSLGESKHAIEYYEQALAISRDIGDRRGEGNRLGNLGNAYFSRGDSKRAIEYHEQALAISRDIGDRRGEGSDLGNLGTAYGSLGDPKHAMEYFEQALAITREIGDRLGEGADLGNLGSAYFSLGESKHAIEYYQQALAISREIGDRGGEGSRLGNIGSAYSSLGESKRAIEYYELALAISREIGDRRGEGSRLGNLGTAYGCLGKTKRAIEYLEQALSISREIGNRRGEGNHLGNLGIAYNSLGESMRAIEYAEKALAIAREMGNPDLEANSVGNLGIAKRREGRHKEALEFFSEAYGLFKKLGNRAMFERSALRSADVHLVLAVSALGGRDVRGSNDHIESAFEIAADVEAEAFLNRFVTSLLIPCLEEEHEHLEDLKRYVTQLFELPVFRERESLLKPLKAVVEYYRRGELRSVLDSLGPAEYAVAGSILERIERPDHVRAKELLGNGKSAEAREVLEGIVTGHPEDLEAQFNLAAALIGEKKYDEAERVLEGISDDELLRGGAALPLSQIAAMRGDMGKSIEILKEAVERYPKTLELHTRLAQYLRNEGRFDELVATLKKLCQATEDADQRLQFNVWLAEAHMLVGEYMRAEVALPPFNSSSKSVDLVLLLRLLRVALTLHVGKPEEAHEFAGGVLRLATELPPGTDTSILSFDVLKECQKFLDDEDFRFFYSLYLTVIGQFDPVLFAEEYLGDKDAEALRKSNSDEAARAVDAFKQGKISHFSDLGRLSTRSTGPLAALAALGDLFQELSERQRGVLFGVLMGAVEAGRAIEVEAAFGSLGQNFPSFDAEQRGCFLEMLAGLGGNGEVDTATRERAVSVLNILYPNLGDDEREGVRTVLSSVAKELHGPALVEFLNETVPEVDKEKA